MNNDTPADAITVTLEKHALFDLTCCHDGEGSNQAVCSCMMVQFPKHEGRGARALAVRDWAEHVAQELTRTTSLAAQDAEKIARAICGVAANDECTCFEVEGEDPNCVFHGTITDWALENTMPGNWQSQVLEQAGIIADLEQRLELAAQDKATSLAAQDGLVDALREADKALDYPVQRGQGGTARHIIRAALASIEVKP